MSEIRTTTLIEEIEVPQEEPMISLSKVITGMGSVALLGTRSSLKGVAATGVIAGRSGSVVNGNVRNPSGMLAKIKRIVGSAKSAGEALGALAEANLIEVSKSEAFALETRIRTILARNDQADVETIARELVASRQSRLQTHLIAVIAESCGAMGFTPTTISSSQGVVSSRRSGTSETLNIEVTKTRDGGIGLRLDGDGFRGSSCVGAIDGFQQQLSKRGVRCVLNERRGKHQRPVLDRARIGLNLQNRCGG